VKRYIQFGADPNKISVGIPIYGRGFTLADPNNHGLYAPATGPSLMGQYVPEAGILGYDEICRNRWPEVTDPQQKSPYAFSGNQWVGYESLASLVVKVNISCKFRVFEASRCRSLLVKKLKTLVDENQLVGISS